MTFNIIGRDSEQQILQTLYNSSQPEFVAIYGRRRIGKTFLIKQFFNKKSKHFFNVTGIQNGDISEQMQRFMIEVGRVFYGEASLQTPTNWFDTFDALTKAINQFVSRNEKIVLFFDELPWMVTHRSKLLSALEYFWNQTWSQDPRIKLIICGSSASWILKKIINNKGGLHNRITQRIRLEPFSLKESKAFLASKGAKLSNKQVTQLYMVTGGIPYYLASAQKGYSAEQLIEQLAFRPNSLLFDEFNNLFSSLFDDAEPYVDLIRTLAKHRYGLSQEALIKQVKSLSRGGRASDKLAALEDAGFIMSFTPHFHKKRGIYYRVVDEYSLFYLRWIEPVKTTLQKGALEHGYWASEQHSPAYASWSGYAFEAICYKHLSQIRRALNIPPNAIANAWRHAPKPVSTDTGAQIDLLFDRQDDIITLGEIKYTTKPLVIDKALAQNLMSKRDVFIRHTKTPKQIFIALISASGLKPNLYSDDLITATAKLDDLFR